MIFIKKNVDVNQYNGTPVQTRNYFELIRGKRNGIAPPKNVEFDDQMEYVVMTETAGVWKSKINVAARNVRNTTRAGLRLQQRKERRMEYLKREFIKRKSVIVTAQTAIDAATTEAQIDAVDIP